VLLVVQVYEDSAYDLVVEVWSYGVPDLTFFAQFLTPLGAMILLLLCAHYCVYRAVLKTVIPELRAWLANM
jgi:hypothetical protein